MICRLSISKARNGIGFEYTKSDCASRDIDGAGVGWILVVLVVIVNLYFINSALNYQPIPQIPLNSALQI